MFSKVTEEEIEEGLNLLAWLIDRHGDAAWPLFERLERELESLQNRKARIESRLSKFG
jgi:hypothetical protein